MKLVYFWIGERKKSDYGEKETKTRKKPREREQMGKRERYEQKAD